MGETTVITGDRVHSPIHFAHPDWTSIAVHDHETASATHHQLRLEWQTDGVFVIGTHFRSPTAGRIRNDDRGWWFATEATPDHRTRAQNVRWLDHGEGVQNGAAVCVVRLRAAA